MDYENLGRVAAPDDIGSYYTTQKKIREETKEENIKAKSFLSIVSPNSNVSLYDHLRNVIEHILRFKVQNAVDNFENISRTLKAQKYEQKDEFVTLPEVDELARLYFNDFTTFLDTLEASVRDVNPAIRGPDEDEPELIEEEDIDSVAEEKPNEPRIPFILTDVSHDMFKFRECGFGLGLKEAYQINLSLTNLCLQYNLKGVRFWGKIFGTSQNYYIAEVPYTEEIPTENYGWTFSDQINGRDSMDADSLDGEKPKTGKSAADHAEELNSINQIPPIPEIKPPVEAVVPVEKNGKGANKFLYFVTNKLLQPWICLPQVRPGHIVHARRLKRFFTGKLDNDVHGGTPFEGVEAHLLRAQIARISASTILYPCDYYRIKQKEIVEKKTEGEEEEAIPPPQTEVAEGEEKEIPETEESEIEENPEYPNYSVMELYRKRLKGWVHSRPMILAEGCCYKMIIKEDKKEENAGENDEQEEKKDEEQVEKDDEKPLKEEIEDEKGVVPRLRLLSEDKGAGGVVPWTLKLSSKYSCEKAVILARSNLWPGAFSYYDGRDFTSTYIGYGYKYSTRDYAPKIEEKWQTEYPLGSDIIEPEDIFPEPLEQGANDAENGLKAEA